MTLNGRSRVLFAGLLAGAAILVACGGGDGGNDEGVGSFDFATPSDAAPCSGLNVTLADFMIEPETAEAAAGDVTFCVDNFGPTPHELKVIRTDEFALDELPLDAPINRIVDEEQVAVVGAMIAMRYTAPTQTFTVNLEPGSYYLICNIASHYQLGTRATLTVQ